jgi:hypothetical protein
MAPDSPRPSRGRPRPQGTRPTTRIDRPVTPAPESGSPVDDWLAFLAERLAAEFLRECRETSDAP